MASLSPTLLPTAECMENWIKFTTTTVGRDKINRFIQYTARFLIWHYQKDANAKETVSKLSKLMAQVGLTRKLMRVGRPVEFYSTAVKILSNKDDLLRSLTVFKSAGMGMWLVFDMLQYFHSVGLKTFAKDTLANITKKAYQCWLFALVSAVLLDLYKLQTNAMKLEIANKMLKAGKLEAGEDAQKEVSTLKAQRKELVLQTVQDTLDISIPASGLGYVQLESGVVGLFGMITSLLGARTQWRAVTGAGK